MIRPDTIEGLRNARNGTLRATAAALGLPEKDAGLLSDILRGVHDNVSHAAENRVRVALGLPPRAPYTVPACASCGGVHTGDCHGKSVKQVVVLGPGEQIRPARRSPTRWADYPVQQLRRALLQRQPYRP